MASVKKQVHFESDFERTGLDLQETWHLEGEGTAEVVDGMLVLYEATESEGLVLWLRQDIPSDMELSFDVAFSNNRGIGVFFLAARGTGGQDILEEMPGRKGAYGEYTRGEINCYGVSLHRFYPDGRHNEGCNLRRNSGFHIVHHAEEDPIMEADSEHHVRILKTGARIQMWVDGKVLHDWTDDSAHGKPLGGGKIGLRSRGDASCKMQIANLTVHAVMV